MRSASWPEKGSKLRTKGKQTSCEGGVGKISSGCLVKSSELDYYWRRRAEGQAKTW